MLGKNLAALIKPEAGKKDKYSENLWNWCRKHRNVPLFVAVSLRDAGVFNAKKTQASALYVGCGNLDEGWLHGSRLIEILCNGVRAGSFAFPPGIKFSVVENWWEQYIEKGKCLIDPEHWLYSGPERWDVVEAQRTCRWCGHIQHRHTVTIPREEWRSYPAELVY